MNNNKNAGLFGFLARLILSMVVVGLTNVIVPGMSNKGGLVNLALISLVIAVVDFLLARTLGLSRASKGFSGFLATAIILYVSGMLLGNYDVSVVGALIGGIVYGLIDSLIPGEKLN